MKLSKNRVQNTHVLVMILITALDGVGFMLFDIESLSLTNWLVLCLTITYVITEGGKND